MALEVSGQETGKLNPSGKSSGVMVFSKAEAETGTSLLRNVVRVGQRVWEGGKSQASRSSCLRTAVDN